MRAITNNAANEMLANEGRKSADTPDHNAAAQWQNAEEKS